MKRNGHKNIFIRKDRLPWVNLIIKVCEKTDTNVYNMRANFLFKKVKISLKSQTKAFKKFIQIIFINQTVMFI